MAAIGTAGSSSSDLELTILRQTANASDRASSATQLQNSAAWASSDTPLSGSQASENPNGVQKPDEDAQSKEDEKRRLLEDEDGMQLVQNVCACFFPTDQFERVIFFALGDQMSTLRFSEDRRMQEVCRLLRSCVRIRVVLARERLEVLEQQGLPGREEQLERLELMAHRFIKFLFLVFELLRVAFLDPFRSCRALALCIGRGMLTLSSLSPVLTETLPIPLLCIDGRVPQAGSPLFQDAFPAPNHQCCVFFVRQSSPET